MYARSKAAAAALSNGHSCQHSLALLSRSLMSVNGVNTCTRDWGAAVLKSPHPSGASLQRVTLHATAALAARKIAALCIHFSAESLPSWQELPRWHHSRPQEGALSLAALKSKVCTSGLVGRLARASAALHCCGEMA